jgi:hypothetical protein
LVVRIKALKNGALIRKYISIFIFLYSINILSKEKCHKFLSADGQNTMHGNIKTRVWICPEKGETIKLHYKIGTNPKRSVIMPKISLSFYIRDLNIRINKIKQLNNQKNILCEDPIKFNFYFKKMETSLVTCRGEKSYQTSNELSNYIENYLLLY